jgi:hypothetical protein
VEIYPEAAACLTKDKQAATSNQVGDLNAGLETPNEHGVEKKKYL